MLFVQFGGAHLLTIFGYDWFWCRVLHPGQFLFRTVLFTCLLLGHVYFYFVLFIFSFSFVYFLDMVSCFVLGFIYVCTYGVRDTFIWYAWSINTRGLLSCI